MLQYHKQHYSYKILHHLPLGLGVQTFHMSRWSLYPAQQTQMTLSSCTADLVYKKILCYWVILIYHISVFESFLRYKYENLVKSKFFLYKLCGNQNEWNLAWIPPPPTLPGSLLYTWSTAVFSSAVLIKYYITHNIILHSYNWLRNVCSILLHNILCSHLIPPLNGWNIADAT